MPTPPRPSPAGNTGEMLLRTGAPVVAIAFAIHVLWPVLAPNTPRPWDGLLTGAGQVVQSSGAPQAVARLVEAPPAVDHHFSGCNAARAAGFENIPFTDPSYRETMDGDGDGWACEPISR